jgi:hypothetical protein
VVNKVGAHACAALQAETLFKGHLLESETYIGGKVEALESGVFRSDLPTRFKCKQSAYQGLIDCLDRDLSYAITHEAGWEMSDVANYDEVKAEITQMLEALREAPNRWGVLGAFENRHTATLVLAVCQPSVNMYLAVRCCMLHVDSIPAIGVIASLPLVMSRALP